jgi:hypothetical protein
MMQKVVTYLYPDTDKAANLKVFQDRTNQIKGFYFTRENIKCVEKLESGTNYAVYFLFDKSADGEMTKVYVGQSKKGAHRMENHHTTKLFWSYCLLFVTDNNSFDALAIDYMEYYFIQLLKKSSQFSLDNKDMRITEPNVSIYDKPTVLSYIEQINFLLKAEGIDFSESPSLSTDNYYSPKSSKYRAKLYVKDGKFVLAVGSVVVRPIESAKDWSDGGKFFDRFTSVIDDFISEGKIQAIDGGYEAIVNLSFNSPSMAASLISGRAENGWLFFEGLNGLR